MNLPLDVVYVNDKTKKPRKGVIPHYVYTIRNETMKKVCKLQNKLSMIK